MCTNIHIESSKYLCMWGVINQLYMHIIVVLVWLEVAFIDILAFMYMYIIYLIIYIFFVLLFFLLLIWICARG